MIAVANFAGLVITTLFAAATAIFLDWILLQAMFWLLKPAAAKHVAPSRTVFGTELVQGTRQIARHFATSAVRR